VTVPFGARRAALTMAALQDLSVATVKGYVSRLLDKLEVDNRVQLALLVQAAGEHGGP
jgi:DNA-binding NarL/FixJ family response regulator